MFSGKYTGLIKNWIYAAVCENTKEKTQILNKMKHIKINSFISNYFTYLPL